MATSATPTQTFVVYAPDADGADCTEFRPQHLANAARLHASGALCLGGAMLSPESAAGGEPKIVGSLVIFQAESLEALRAELENEIYYKAGVWDREKLVILPFMAVTPFP
ncbi:YCII domain-containing protein [Mycena kentingensis (nom. inval.)]|nr:YCII domain-containing protein [Mycena kentingensis (nom. inval.)]